MKGYKLLQPTSNFHLVRLASVMAIMHAYEE